MKTERTVDGISASSLELDFAFHLDDANSTGFAETWNTASAKGWNGLVSSRGRLQQRGADARTKPAVVDNDGDAFRHDDSFEDIGVLGIDVLDGFREVILFDEHSRNPFR